jgi:hypothetical protein
MILYLEAYQALYRRTPRELRDLGSGWILVNDAKLTLPEFAQLTLQLQRELQQERARTRGLVNRLLRFFNGGAQPRAGTR